MALNQNRHSCEDFDGECNGWKGYHGNDHDLTADDYNRQQVVDFDRAVAVFRQAERQARNADDWGFSD